ncbi:hypothetical protein GXB85_05425 [Cellulomonas sp. APG4]|uniref:hypothetical protein n=1 Tax=Cellulomonas sp. APG4 TaxID=1538656 RepID=UPI00137B40F9|nr:hypothetical protein [Cellulomonas sp. APG4]NCT90392.1 hypothetical protein [Cellulomonas sp. APG4]
MRTEAMRAWSQMPLQAEQPDLLLRLAKTPRQAVVAALDGVVRGSEFDPFDREPDGSFLGQRMSHVVWDATATVYLLRRLTFLLLKTSERMESASRVAVLKRYDANLAGYLQRLRAGEVRLIRFDADAWEREALENLMVSDETRESAARDLEEAFHLRLVKDDTHDPSLGTAYLREGATPELRRYLRARRLKKQRREGEPVFSTLEEALTTDEDHIPLSGRPLSMEEVREQRRRERAQRLHERRGGVGEVAEPREEPGEPESGSARLRLVRDPLQHPDIIWDE